MSERNNSIVRGQEQQRPLLNLSREASGREASQPMSRKKKIFIGLGILLLIGIVLAIVLPLTLKKSSNHDDDNGGNLFDNQEYNPFSVVNTTWNFTQYNGDFVVNTSTPAPTLMKNYQEQEMNKLFMCLREDPPFQVMNIDYKPVDTSNVTTTLLNKMNINNLASDQVRVKIGMVDNFDVRLLISDNHNQKSLHLVPEEVFPRPPLSWESRLSQVGFQSNNVGPFSFSFSNIYTNKTIITTQNRKLFVSDKFSEIGFSLPTQRCFGLGQRNGQFQLQYGTYSLHSRFREEGLPLDDGLGDKNGNHIHPFILCQTTDKDFFGMFFVSSAPQVFEVLYTGSDPRMVLNYINMARSMEIYTIMRGKPAEIIAKYHSLIGTPAMPPFFALGFFQGSNTYNSLTKLKSVVQNYSDDGVALEGVFLNNYNEQPHRTFTLSDSFKNIPDFIKSLQTNNQRIILGASMAIQNNYDVFKLAVTNKCLVDSYQRDKLLIGILDEKNVSYIDSFQIGAQPFFEQTLPNFYNTVGSFDGLQIQDAHFPNQISGEVDQTNTTNVTASQRRRLKGENSLGTYMPYQISVDQTYYSLYNLPFQPTQNNLDYLTVSLNASQSSPIQLLNFFLHNANSHRALQKVNASWSQINPNTQNTRPLLFSDSSYAGSGSYGIGLLTDMQRSWDNLKGLVAQVMGMSLFGMSNVMVDGCGSLGKLDEELCARWMQVSAFFPMFRGYYNETYLDPVNNTRNQTDPSEYRNFQEFDYQVAFASAISQRLPLMRYIYSSLFQAHRKGAAVIKPMFYDFPEDDKAFQLLEQTFMLGDSIKVSPVLEQGLKEGDTYKVYFPAGYWYDLNDPKTVINTTGGGDYISLNASNTSTNIHLKSGRIIPFQLNTGGYKTTKDFETKLRMSFKIARDDSLNHAEGQILIDDGISADSYTSHPDIDNHQNYTFWKLRYAEKSINFWVESGDFSYEPPQGYQIHYLQNIDILNASDLSDTDFACYAGLNFSPVNLTFKFNPFTQVFTLSPNGSNPDIKFKDINLIKFGNSKNGDLNICDPNSFMYHQASANKEDPNYWFFNLIPNAANTGLKHIIAIFEQLDDFGTINLQITTQEDFDSGNKTIYRVPDIVFNSQNAFPVKGDLRRQLKDFLIVSDATSPAFTYSLYKDTTDPTTKVWSSDPSKFLISEYFVMDSGIFDMNPDVDQPLIGMGERGGSLFYKNEVGGVHSRYTFDQANPIDDGLPPGKNMYGFQPFYAFQTAISTHDWFGVFDINPYATDYILYSKTADSHTQIHKISIGGIINKYFFIGSKPDDIIKTYSKLVGYPAVPPLWAFGWQQSRFGYKNENDWAEVIKQYELNNLPLDTMWADIDYMDDYKIFTISNETYPNLAQMVDDNKKKGITFVPIMDPAVAVRKNQNYLAYDTGMQNDVFIKQANKIDPLTAGVFCGNAYFPDFFNPNTTDWWHSMFADLYVNQGLHFDGIWLDENEATNFCNGYCNQSERPANSLRNKPFYVPGWRDLDDQALGVDGWHESIQRNEYDVHNLFSLMQVKATADFLTQQQNRPYILTRANFPGIGKYAHHWMGDNWSTVQDMKLTVDGIYSYNLFAMPFMGSDICGFNGDPTPELCTRWHILGSLYPFSRNHDQNASSSQEPYVFQQIVPGTTDTKFVDVIRIALRNRYSLIRYYYSAFYMFGSEGGSFFKPLFYEYPLDNKAYQDIQVNILLGDALKLSMETTTVDFKTYPERNYYFPQDRWCRIFPALTDPQKDCYDSPGGDNGYFTLPSSIESYYIHLRNGYIIPKQNAISNNVNNTQDLASIPTDLYTLPLSQNVPMSLSSTSSMNAVAKGFIIFDDGTSIMPTIYAKFEFYIVKAADGNSFSIKVSNKGDMIESGSQKTEGQLNNIYVLWASKSGFSNMKTVTITLTSGTQTPPINISIDANTETVTIPISSTTQQYYFWDIQQIDIQ